jgi:hypothetical protein
MFISYENQYNQGNTMNEKALETGPLERLFNGIASAKILDFLIVFRDYDYSKQDIAKNSGVSFRHSLREIEKLEKLQLIKQTRSVGHAKMYKLNTENPITSLLQKFTLDLAYQECQKTLQEEPAEKEQHKQAATIRA